jgi:hypothetical protein
MKRAKIEKRELECNCGKIDIEYVPETYSDRHFYTCKECYNNSPISTNSGQF